MVTTYSPPAASSASNKPAGEADPLNVTTTTAASAQSTLRFPHNEESRPDLIEVTIQDTSVEYQLDPDDVRNVLERFTAVHAVSVDPLCPSKATVYVSGGTGADVVRVLDGQQLQGMEGVLSATCVTPQYQALIDLLLMDQSADLSTENELAELCSPAYNPPRQVPSSTPCRPAAPSPEFSPESDSELAPPPTSASGAALDESSSKYLTLLLDLCSRSQPTNAPDPWARASPHHDEALRGGDILRGPDPTAIPPRGDPSLPPYALLPVGAGYATPTSLSEFDGANAGFGSPSPFATPASSALGGPYSHTAAFSPWTQDSANGSAFRLSALRSPNRVCDDLYLKPPPPPPPPTGDGSSSRPKTRKWTARYDIQINPEESFQVTRRIIGTRGANMKRINQLTGAKLRLRGQGSGYLEGSSRQEAEDPLHLCISCCDGGKYKIARHLTENLLKVIYTDYDTWVSEQGGIPPRLHVRYRELYLPTRGGRDEETSSSRITPGDEAVPPSGRRGGGGSSSSRRR